MRCLQTLELKVDNDDDLKQLSLTVAHFREVTMHFSIRGYFKFQDIFKQFMGADSRPSIINVISLEKCAYDSGLHIIDCATQLTPFPTGTTTTFFDCTVVMIKLP